MTLAKQDQLHILIRDLENLKNSLVTTEHDKDFDKALEILNNIILKEE